MSRPTDRAGSRTSVARPGARAAPQSENDCVETAFLADGGVAVRHSKDPDGSVLRYTRREWAAFLKGAKDGEFDPPPPDDGAPAGLIRRPTRRPSPDGHTGGARRTLR